MLNSNSGTEAKLRYLANDYEVIKSGQYVTCAVTGNKISIADLRYWSATLQEAYEDAQAAEQRYRSAGAL